MLLSEAPLLPTGPYKKLSKTLQYILRKIFSTLNDSNRLSVLRLFGEAVFAYLTSIA